jgi:hypothetical protein
VGLADLTGNQHPLATKPARLLILERARALIEDGRHWCPGDLARDARGLSVNPTDSNAEQRCALGAILAAAYQFTGDLDRAQEIAMVAIRPVIGATSLTHVNDAEGHATILNLFDLAIAAQ